MAWPYSAHTSFVANTTRIAAAFLNSLQTFIAHIFNGTYRVKRIEVNSAGGATTVVSDDNIYCVGSITGVGTVTGTAGLQTGNTVLGAKLASNDAAQGLELRDGSTVYGYQRVSHVQTTNGTITTVLIIPVPTGKAVAVLARGVGLKADASAGIYHFVAAGRRNNAGTVSVIGSDQNLITAQTDLGGGGVSCVTSGTNVLVQVTGVAATTVNWGVYVDVSLSP